MPDYKAMYEKMFVATENAMDILIKAQRECEAMYMEGADEDENV